MRTTKEKEKTMLTLAQVEAGCKVAYDVENVHIFGYAKELLKKNQKKVKKNPNVIVEMDRIDGHKPGSQEAIEAMRIAAETDLDLFTGQPGEKCPEACFSTKDGLDDAHFEDDGLDMDISLLWGNKLAVIFRGV